MPYRLDAVEMQTDMSPESMQSVTELWNDIASGKLPLLYTSDGTFVNGLLPVTEYSDYADILDGAPCRMIIRTVEPSYFDELNKKVEEGSYRLYEAVSDSGNLPECSEEAWNMAHADDEAGKIKIDYSIAVESTVPGEYTPDGKARCMLYVKLAS